MKSRYWIPSLMESVHPEHFQQQSVVKNNTIVKELLILTLFMIVNLLVITGILLQFEQDLKEKSLNIEKVLLQSNERERRDLLYKGKSKSGDSSPFKYDN